MEFVEIAIRTEKIALDQFLKWARVCETGGMAKLMIKDGLVSVNGQVETRRGRRLKPGDEVIVRGRGSFRVVADAG